MAEIQDVRVLNDGYEPFESKEIISVSVDTDCRFPMHPVEDGTVQADTIVRGPTRITLQVILDPENYLATYENIRWLNTDMIKCEIQTKSDTYTDMYLENYPHKEDASKYDTIEMTLIFVQQMIATVDNEKLNNDDVADPADASTIDRGQQLPQSA